MSEAGERLVLKDAYNWTKARRPVAHPNNAFLVQLAKEEMNMHGGRSSVVTASEKIWKFYELNMLRKEAQGVLPSKLSTGGLGCVIG